MSEAASIRGVDFHCHLDLYPDHPAAVAKAEAAGIYTLTVTTTPKAWQRNYELTRHTRYVRAALGLHPQLIADRADELSLWERHLPETRYVGEVGLDAGPRFYKSFEGQKEVFRRVLVRCAETGGKILSAHSVRSAPAVLDMIEAHLPRERGTVVLHWFTGSKSDARRAATLGCYFSINAEMTRTDRGRDLIASIPRNRIITETDGPFTKTGGRPTEPGDVLVASEALAGILGVSENEMAKIIQTNLRSLIR